MGNMQEVKDVTYAALLSKHDFHKLLVNSPFLSQSARDNTYFLAESLPQHVITAKERQDLLCFCLFDFDEHVKEHVLADFTSGRIFRREFELRWEREREQVCVTYIGAPQSTLPGTAEIHATLSPTLTGYYLFGRRLARPQEIGLPDEKNLFAVARIPRLLRYPKPGPGDHVKLLVREYRDPKTDTLLLYRFYDLDTE